MKKFNKYLLLLMSVFGLLATTSCEQEDSDSPYVTPEDPEEESKDDSTILIYAIATNSLKANLEYDKSEMLEAAKDINLEKNNVLIYQVAYIIDEETGRFTNDSEVTLNKLVKNKEGYNWEVVKEYSRDKDSLDPTRVSEVISYITQNYSAETYGLFFWSHSTGSQPFLTSRSIAENAPMTYSFGQDKTTSDAKYEQINVDELADAIPDNVFHYIWFDSCYMGNIESIYQMRNKCDYYIGYPTEVCDDGNPYNYVLPYLTSKNPDILGAAQRFITYYKEEYYYHAGTISVTDMSKIEMLADYCQHKLAPVTLYTVASLQKYTRSTSGPFYELGDYLKYLTEQEGGEFSDEEWKALLDECLLFRDTTPNDFNGRRINQERYSGISAHIYNFESTTDTEKFYKSLDWFNRVFSY